MYKDLVSEQTGQPNERAVVDEAEVQYSRGLVLQELASKTPPNSPEHQSYLEQVKSRILKVFLCDCLCVILVQILFPFGLGQF